MLGHFHQQGDTIIEVLLAITVFSMVSIGAMTIMNQGTNAAQRALEITQVRQQIDAQAEALRAAQQSYTANPVSGAWTAIAQPIDTPHYTDQSTCPTTQPSDSLLMDARTAKVADPGWYKDINTIGDVADAAPYAQVRYESGNPESYGLWIERDYTASSNATVPNSYEFIIKACWYAAGISNPLSLETSVRLYDPAA